jgi:hypothetical protein
MNLDRDFLEVQLLGNRLVRVASDQAGEHFLLTPGQMLRLTVLETPSLTTSRVSVPGLGNER